MKILKVDIKTSYNVISTQRIADKIERDYGWRVQCTFDYTNDLGVLRENAYAETYIPTFPTPEEIIAFLDERIEGVEQRKRQQEQEKFTLQGLNQLTNKLLQERNK